MLERLPKEIQIYLLSFVATDNGCRYKSVSKTFAQQLAQAAPRCPVVNCSHKAFHTCATGTVYCHGHKFLHKKLECRKCSAAMCLCDATTVEWEANYKVLADIHPPICSNCGGTAPLCNEDTIKKIIYAGSMRPDAWWVSKIDDDKLWFYYKGVLVRQYELVSGQGHHHGFPFTREYLEKPVLYSILQNYCYNVIPSKEPEKKRRRLV